jgi:glycosyltransferase involved in cell wall biosynthesis
MRSADGDRDVVIAILAKDKAVTLPLYLQCILDQTFPKDRIHLYIRANDSSDDTNDVLQAWVDRYGSLYKSVTADYTDIGGLRHYENHEWNRHRFSVLARIRQDSVDFARRLGCHYFVVDLDNFIIPDTLQNIYDAGLPVLAPLLRSVRTVYANYHFSTDKHGYYFGCREYYDVLDGKVRGFIAVNVVHCAYLMRYETLEHACYDDGTERFEYVIFSDHLRNDGVGQYLDNRQIYGLVAFLGGESEATHGGFDHDDFVRRLANLATFTPKLVNDRPDVWYPESQAHEKQPPDD